MCLVFFAYSHHPDYRVILAANRDEFYHRPTDPMAFWSDAPDILAGRDLEAGGTWLGIHRSGRWAALTNYRDPAAHRSDATSRGALIGRFLSGRKTAMDYVAGVSAATARYNGFNLVVDDGRSLAYLDSRTARPRELGPGIYGLSNHLLDTPWPKVSNGKRRFERLVASETVSTAKMMTLLADRRVPPDAALPDTGVGLEWERRLGPIFIASPDYGTRCSSVLRITNSGRVEVAERSYQITQGAVSGTKDRRFAFQVSGGGGF
ncbi:MAG: NRDE family protein [Pseudomonadota bacterium]